MLLANDCENPDPMGEPRARSTGLPELDGYDTGRDADGSLSRVTVRLRLPADDRSSSDRLNATYDVTDGHATPLRVASPYDHVDDPSAVRRYLTVLLAAEEAVRRLDDVESVQTVGELAKDIWTREPESGYEPAGATEHEVEQAVAEVSD